MTALKKICLIVLVLASSGLFATDVASQSDIPVEAKKLIDEGDEICNAKQDNWWNQAAESYWQALIAGGGEKAIKGLTTCYNSWTRREKFDWNIVRKYVQAAADAEFKRRRLKAENYTGKFVITASADSIREKLAIDVISQKYIIWGDKRVEYALENLFKRYYLGSPTNGERCYFPAMVIKKWNSNSVAVIDNKTVKKIFRFHKEPDPNWSIYVKSPYNGSRFLFPFKNYHIYAFEQKTKAFKDLCGMLGAKKITVKYLWKNGRKISGDAMVAGQTLQGVAAGVRVRKNKNQEYELELEETFCAWIVPKKVISKWFEYEPSWERLANNRTQCIGNYLVGKKESLSYTDDNDVNITVKAAFQHSLAKIGVNVDFKLEEYEKTRYDFVVDFSPAITRLPITRTLELH